MKVEDFRSARQPEEIPGQMTVEEVIAEVEQEQVYTSLTPSGIEVLYSPTPRRHYKVRSPERPDGSHNFDWFEVPSVTTVLGVLDKSGPLIWWGQGVGVSGVQELFARDLLNVNMFGGLERKVAEGEYIDVDAKDVVNMLTEFRLSTNHVKDKAADRGTSVHKAFEAWCENQEYRPDPELFEENERGYITALAQFLEDIDGCCSDIESELMVGSIEHGYAGRFDCRLTKDVSNLVVKAYPKRENKVAETPAGKWLIDVKTSKSVYPTHALQLAAYELASVECGYGPTDYRAVLHLQSDGQYELVQTHAQAEDWLSVLATYQTMQKAKGWM